jgi:CRISPR type IV-associated protein Csf1
MTTTELTRIALKCEPVGEPTSERNSCVCCGKPIAVGDIASAFSPSNGFMDGRALLHLPGRKPVLCGDCAMFFAKGAMMKIQKAVVTTEGAFPIGKIENRAWFILHPPKPPFAVVFSNAKLQHLLWRTPLSLDQNHWLIQLGSRTLTMNRRRVLDAHAACLRIGDAYLAAKKKQLRSPFLSLDPKFGDCNTGVIRPDILKFASEQQLGHEISCLRSLGTGELWGLCAIIFRHDVAVQPARLALSRSNAEQSGTDESEE